MSTNENNMKIIISVNKPPGFTPNQIIEKVRKQFPHFDKEKIGFAGRLDPMARGVLLLMIGDANFEREKYLNLDKTYEFTALLGIETDSYDLLGLLNQEPIKYPPSDYLEMCQKYINSLNGVHDQEYPPFSTKPVQGKNLFKWAKEGKLSEIEIPTKEITIYSIEQLSTSQITAKELKKIINEKINKIEGHFRQEETIEKWNELLDENNNQEFKTISFKIRCSSGTYVRSIVHNLGKKLGCGAVTLDINRTKVGNYKLEDSLNLNYEI